MRPRRQKTQNDEAEMEPVEVFARIKCAPSNLVCSYRYRLQFTLNLYVGVMYKYFG